MRKRFINHLLFGFLILGIFLAPKTVWAKSYSINKVEINAVINQNGSAEVSEKRDFKFNGDYTFAYEYINKYGDRKIPYDLENFSVCEENGDCYQKLDESNKLVYDENRPENSFYVEDQGDRYYIKWFYKASNETRVFILKYRVKNIITLHQDIAELYWKFVGDDWEIDQSNIKLTITLPEGIPDSEIKAWGHGPLNGKVSIPNNRTVVYEVDNLNSGVFVEARVTTPLNIFTGGAVGDLSKSLVNDEEEIFIAETEREKQKTELVDKYGSIGVLITLVLVIFLFAKQIRQFKKYGKDLRLPEVSLSGRLWEPPSDIDPAQVEQLINARMELSPRSFTATILSLVEHRFYKLVRSDKKEGVSLTPHRNLI